MVNATNDKYFRINIKIVKTTNSPGELLWIKQVIKINDKRFSTPKDQDKYIQSNSSDQWKVMRLNLDMHCKTDSRIFKATNS